MGRRRRCSSVTYRSRYAPSSRLADDPFSSQPSGRGQLAVFPRCSLLTYRFRYARRLRLEKQPTDRRRKPCYLWDRTLVLELLLPHLARLSLVPGSKHSPSFAKLFSAGAANLSDTGRSNRRVPMPQAPRGLHFYSLGARVVVVNGTDPWVAFLHVVPYSSQSLIFFLDCTL
jgi:hypothetical protein